mgnify:FL=1
MNIRDSVISQELTVEMVLDCRKKLLEILALDLMSQPPLLLLQIRPGITAIKNSLIVV